MKRWLDKHLFTPDDPRPYAILRVVLGTVAALNFLCYLPYLELFFSDAGFYPRESMATFETAPYLLSLLYLSGDPVWVNVVFGFSVGVSALFAAGVKVRWTGPMLWLALASFIHRNVFVVDGCFILLLQIMIVFMFCDSGAVWSWDAKRRKTPAPVYRWVGWVLRFQICLIYFMSGVYKLMGADWVSGQAIRYVMANPGWRRFDLDTLLAQEWVILILVIAGAITPWWELLFPLLVLQRHARAFALGFGVFLHGAQWFTINTSFFVPVLLTLYLFFLPGDFAVRVYEWLRKRLKS